MISKIMTVIHNDPAEFDKTVNAAISDGYSVITRHPIPFPDGLELYAELVREEMDEPHVPDPLEALRLVQDYCKHRVPNQNGEVCAGCPVERFCDNNKFDAPPHKWKALERSAHCE